MHANQTSAWLLGLGIGAAAMALLDPASGGRRRALVRDKAAWSLRKGRDAYDATRRDFSNRMTGLAARTRSLNDTATNDDDVIVERVRATLGRYCSHPGSVEVASQSGVVTLFGPILTDEIESVVHAVERVKGVERVDNLLEPHAEPGSVPGLQGGKTRSYPRSAFLQDTWSPTTRVLAGSAGLGLMLVGLRRSGIVGSLTAAAGAALFTRGVADTQLRGLGSWAGALTRIP